jgi:hypothetical protein
MGNLVMAYAQQLNMTLEKGEDLYNQLMSIRKDGTDFLICPDVAPMLESIPYWRVFSWTEMAKLFLIT